MNRRQVFVGLGTGAALVGAGGWWRVSREPEAALAPWRSRQQRSDVRLDAFAHAILAPNPHNRQPWLIKLIGTDQALLHCDLAKRLPETDPFDRQITIGFGTFIELARMAAAERGYAMTMVPFPDGEPQPRLDRRPLARLTFRRDASTPRDPLFAPIRARRTNRELYDAAPPPAPLLAAVAHAGDARTSVDPVLMGKVRPVTARAMTTEVTTERTWMESVRLTRIGAREIDANPDGLAIKGPMMEAMSALGMLDRAQLADMDSAAFRTGLDMVEKMCASVPALLWIATPGNSRADQLDAGRRYVRCNLRATMLGLAMHPLSQAL